MVPKCFFPAAPVQKLKRRQCLSEPRVGESTICAMSLGYVCRNCQYSCSTLPQQWSHRASRAREASPGKRLCRNMLGAASHPSLNLLESSRIPWSSTEFYGILWVPMGFHGILAHPHAQTWPRRHLEVLEVSFARSLEVFGVAPRTALGAPILMESDGVPWNSMGFYGISVNCIGFRRILLNPSKFNGVLRNSVESCGFLSQP